MTACSLNRCLESGDHYRIYDNSLSANFKLVENEDMQEKLKFLRHEKDTDVYLDRSTGKEVYVVWLQA